MAPHNRRPQAHFWLALLTVTVLLASCASPVPTPNPRPTAVGTSAVPAATTAPTPTTSPPEPPTATPGPLASPAPSPSVGPDLAISTVARALPDPSAAKTAAAAIDAFGLDLFRRLLADPSLALLKKNAVFSPTSIALALAMARAGARGQTATQMDAVLRASGAKALLTGLNGLDQALASRQALFTDEQGSPQVEPALRIANAAYFQRGWSIEQPYLDALASAFGAGLRLVDFQGDPEGARKTIDAWVGDQTAGQIPELLAPSDVGALTRFVLANAVYLKAQWEWWFDPNTKPAPFIRLDGTQVQVPTMHRNGPIEGMFPIPYVAGTGWQAVELRYLMAEGSAPLAMTLILPDDLAAFEAHLTPAQLGRITAALAQQHEAAVRVGPCTGALTGYQGGCYPYDLSLYLPRFSIETRADLIPALTALGMPLAFRPGSADFTGIHVPSEIAISPAVHQATIDVDEKGTTASAATALGGYGAVGGPMPQRKITVRFDHPFLFLLRDIDTGAVLFMGQVTDPSMGKGS